MKIMIMKSNINDNNVILVMIIFNNVNDNIMTINSNK